MPYILAQLLHLPVCTVPNCPNVANLQETWCYFEVQVGKQYFPLQYSLLLPHLRAKYYVDVLCFLRMKAICILESSVMLTHTHFHATVWGFSYLLCLYHMNFDLRRRLWQGFSQLYKNLSEENIFPSSPSGIWSILKRYRED